MMALSKTQLLTAGISVVYAGISFFHFKEGRKGLATAFLGYTIANMGLILAEE
tara:strand:- start:503 stop:661 length:159 start_codon:yes stop_codon:yes gene_type:complete